MTWHFPVYPENWDEIRKRVYKRDNYTCLRCGSRGGIYGDAILNCAHIISKTKGGTDDDSNLETACEDCHVDEHPHMLNNPKIRQRYLEKTQNNLISRFRELISR